jgi:hypothetical protein
MRFVMKTHSRRDDIPDANCCPQICSTHNNPLLENVNLAGATLKSPFHYFIMNESYYRLLCF